MCSIETVEDMIKMGVYVNDLNLHDSSRELILAGTQQSAELQLALDQVGLRRSEDPCENGANWTRLCSARSSKNTLSCRRSSKSWMKRRRGGILCCTP